MGCGTEGSEQGPWEGILRGKDQKQEDRNSRSSTRHYGEVKFIQAWKLATKTSVGENRGAVMRTWREEREMEAEMPKQHSLSHQILN